MSLTIAIDGPAAAGKGTIAAALAKQFGFVHLDTGTLYRAVGVKTLHLGRGVITLRNALRVAEALTLKDLTRDDLRTPRAARAASKVAVIPEVRTALVEMQRRIARSEPGAVLDGRDIGTVICPEAEVKLFITASDEIRAKRRFDELRKKGLDTSLEAVTHDLKQRDARDAERDTAPMRMAEDAVLLDTSEMTIETAVACAANIIIERQKAGRT